MVVEEEENNITRSLLRMDVPHSCLRGRPDHVHTCALWLHYEPEHRACLTHLPCPGVRTQPWIQASTRSTPRIWARHCV